MSGRQHSSRLASLVAIVASFLVVMAGPASAADAARIQGVTTENGQVAFLLTASGLTAGEGLDASTVQVSIDGQQVPSATEAATSVQRSVYLVMDTSGSMKGQPLASAKSAAQQYLTTVPPDVAVGLITFADQATVAVPATTDRGAVSSALDAARAEGSTALFDAAVLATQQLGAEGSRSIVLLSDGEDEGSAASEAQALTAITTTGVALDAVALTDGLGAEQVNKMALASGGTVVQAAGAEQLSAAFESAARSAASQVLVTAELPPGQQAGTYPLTVSVKVGDAVLSDEAVVVIDPATAAAAAAANAEAVGPVPVQTRTISVMDAPWFLPLAVLVLFGAFATIGLLAFRLISDEAVQPRRVSRRIDSYGIAAASVADSRDQSDSVIAQRAVAAAEQVLSKRDPDRALERKLATAAIPLKPGEWAVLHFCIALSSALVAAAVTGLSVLWGVVGLLVGAFVPYAVLDIRGSRRRKQFYQSLPEVLQLLSGSVASGYSFPQAVDTVANQSKGVVADEFGRAVAEARLGVPIEDALMDVANRMESRDFEWVVMAVAINRRVGGNLAEVLRTVSKTLRERERVRRQIAALTAEGRLSAIILAALPVLLVVYMLAVRPDYLAELVTNPIGLFMAITSVVLVVVGVIWMRRMIKIEV